MVENASGPQPCSTRLSVASTQALARDRPSDSLAFWIDWVCAHLVRVQCDTSLQAQEFHGSVAQRQFAAMSLTHISSTRQRVRRTKTHLAGASDEHVLVNIQRQGVSRVVQRGREAVLHPGDVAFYSSAEPYELSFDSNFKQTVMIMPAALATEWLPDVNKLSAVALRRDPAFARTLLSLADAVHGLDEAASPVVEAAAVQGLLHFLATGVANGLRGAQHARNWVDASIALNAIGHGVWLVDEHARVLFANAQAQAMTATESGVKHQGDELHVEGCCASDLRALLAAAIARGRTARLPLRDSSGRSDRVISVHRAGSALAPQPVAMVQIQAVSGRQKASAEHLRLRYGLTPAEARVALNWVDAASVQALSKAQSVSVNTLKSQIRQVYGKLGVDTKSDLVRLLMGDFPER